MLSERSESKHLTPGQTRKTLCALRVRNSHLLSSQKLIIFAPCQNLPNLATAYEGLQILTVSYKFSPVLGPYSMASDSWLLPTDYWLLKAFSHQGPKIHISLFCSHLSFLRLVKTYQILLQLTNSHRFSQIRTSFGRGKPPAFR